MYRIYTTPSIILRSFSFAEADKSYEILTREFGLLIADARSVRKIDSKLRYSLCELSECNLSILKGKERWRITSAELGINFFELLRGRDKTLAVFKRVISLTRRLVPEAEKNEVFFDILRNGMIFLCSNNLEGKDLDNFECIIVLKMLHCLGYLGTSPDFVLFADSPFFDNSLIFEMDKKREDAVMAINKSIRESHL
jgi:DNA repair protein RecO